MQYEVIDNYLPQEEFEVIKNIIMNNQDFPWFYRPTVAFGDVEEQAMYFIHMFYLDFSVKSGYTNALLGLINKIGAKALIRVKANMYTNLGNLTKNLPHVDYDFKHKGAIYYLNTNNGPTVLEDGTKIEAVENRILFFDPSKEHYSTHCTDQKVRVNININYF